MHTKFRYLRLIEEEEYIYIYAWGFSRFFRHLLTLKRRKVEYRYIIFIQINRGRFRNCYEKYDKFIIVRFISFVIKL